MRSLNRSPGRMAAHIALIYVAAAALWILLSDRCLILFIDDPNRLVSLQMLKKWSFVLVTGGLLFAVLRRLLASVVAAEESLWEQQSLLRAVVEGTSDAVYVKDPHGRYLQLNSATAAFLGRPRGELLGQDDTEVFSSAEAAMVMAGDRDVMAGGRTITYEENVTTPDGVRRTFLSTKGPVRNQSGEVVGLFGIARDITERRRAEAELHLRHRAVEASSNGILILDAGRPGHPVIYANPAFARITGFAPEEMKGRGLDLLLREEAGAGVRAALRLGEEMQTVLPGCRPDGSLFWTELFLAPVRDRAGGTTHFVCILNDVTERRQYQAQLEHQSTHDALTGLANRHLLLDRLGQALHFAERSSRIVAVLLIDLDRFKTINDSLGHSVGDELLQSVSRLLAGTVRAMDTVARLGGDEFVIALAEVADVDDVARLVQRFQDRLAEPYLAGGREMRIGASIGVSLFPRDGTDEGTLLHNADIAMYGAKEEGGGTYRFFAPEMNQRVMETLEMEADLRRALERGELFLHYQPEVDLASGRIRGCEALVRWLHPEKGIIPPASFIPLAEETGLILAIGEWVLATACAQARAWQRAGLPLPTMAVNLSARQFRQPDLAERVGRILQAGGLEPRHLELELTETVLMRDPEGAAATIGKLKALGVALFLDDFGTGYSSLNYLRRFPVDGLKIDRAFIADVATEPSGAVAASIVAIAHSLRLTAVAEGVETREQLEFLARCRCDAYQGDYFSRPLPPAEFAALLRADSAGGGAPALDL